MGFGPVERVRKGRGEVVVIPFGKWRPGKKNRSLSMAITREICTDSFYTHTTIYGRIMVVKTLALSKGKASLLTTRFNSGKWGDYPCLNFMHSFFTQ